LHPYWKFIEIKNSFWEYNQETKNERKKIKKITQSPLAINLSGDGALLLP
jgi:hypothetical protein